MKIFFPKKIMIGTIIIGTCVGIGFGIYKYQQSKQKPVNVYKIMDIGMFDYWMDSQGSDGQVREDKTQSVYLSTTQEGDKILVKQGDSVKKGMPLIKYNTTLNNLEIERKALDIKKMKIDLDKQKAELEKIKTYKPDVPIYGNQNSIAEVPKANENNVSDIILNLSKPLPEVPKENEIIPAPLTGEGTKDKPYIFLWENGKTYTTEFISKLIQRTGELKTEVFAIFMVRENNELQGQLNNAVLIKFQKNITDYSFEIVKTYLQDEDPILGSKIEDVIEEIPTILEDVGPSYSASELKKMILEKENEISELAINIKVAEAEHKKLKNEISDNVVYSKIDGVVKTVLPLDSDEKNTQPIIVISGGGGYYITGTVNEFELENTKVGQEVSVSSYSTGKNVTGKITEISSIPVANNAYYSGSNANSSNYPYTVFVSEEGSLKQDDYVSLKPVQEEATDTSLYLMKAFVLDENGKKYVYVANRDNKLEKREVIVAGGLYDFYKIKSGLIATDKVAFPYGKNLKINSDVVESSIDDLYNGM